MEIDGGTEKTEEKTILEKLVEVSEDFLQSAGNNLNYQKMTDTILYISGAKYAAFDLYDEDGSKFTTIALSGPSTIINKISSLLGFNLLGKVWQNDPVRAAKIKLNPAIYFLSAREYAADLLSKPVALLIGKTMNMDKVAIVKILKDDIMVGNFTLGIPKKSSIKNEDFIKIYTRQVGLLITRNRSESRLIESEKRLKSVFDAANDPLFIFEQKTGAILDVNKAACSLYGYSRDEMLKLKNTDMSAEPEITRRVIRESALFVPVRKHLKKDGTVFKVEISVSYFELNGQNMAAASIRDITERLKSEEALQQSEEKFRSLVENSQDIIYSLDLKGKFTFVSPSWTMLLGHPLDQVIGKPFTQFIHPDDIVKCLFFAQKIIETQQSQGSVEYRAKHADESWRWFNTRAVLAKDNTGKIVDYQGISRDITDAKKAEEALKRSEAHFKTIFNEAPLGIALTDSLTGHIYSINPMFTRIVGRTMEEMTSIDWMSITHPDDIQKDLDNMALLNSGKINRFQMEKRYIRPDGSIVWINMTTEPVYVADKAHPRHLCMIEDITDRKLAEEELRNSEEKYRLLTENASDVIWVLNLTKGKYIYISPSIFNLRGLTPKEAMNESLKDSLVPESFKTINEIITKKLKDFIKSPDVADDTVVEVQQPCKNGDIIWVEVSTKPRYNSEGQIEVVGVSRNITDRKKIEQEIIHLSFHDMLTSLYNRRFFEEEISRLDTERQLPLSFIMGDLNGLKIINDVFGHINGDNLLKKTAGILKKVCRSDDILARWGGDEFVILLPKTSIEDAEEIAKRIKNECKKINSSKIPLSLSIGVAAKIEAKQDMQVVLIDAESNMYKNKLVEKESLTSSIVFALEQALFEKSNETKEHTDRIYDLASKLGKEVKLSSSQLDELTLLAALHDIGKVAISDTILLKKDKLTEKEWEIIKRHPEIGFNIAQSSAQIAHIAKPILACHENWDGSGYPLELKGEAIPVISRIIFIVDAYDVMTNKRPYKKPMAKEDAIKELKRCAGTQFDPVLVEKFIKIISSNSNA